MPALTWGDVEITLGGLELFFEQSGMWAETWFEVVGEGRGVLGDGLVRGGGVSRGWGGCGKGRGGL